MNNIEELENKIEQLSKELENLKCELDIEKMNTRWRARNSEAYYYLYSYGKIIRACDYRSKETTNRYNLGNYFRTKEEAEKMLNKIKIYTQLKDLAMRLNKGEKIDWQDENQDKYCICYFHDDKKLNSSLTLTLYCRDIGQIYCLDKNFLEEAKKEIGEENLKKLFEWVRIWKK